MIGDESGLLTVLQFADSALPTGAFSQSLGLETAIHDDAVHDEATFQTWLHRFLHHQLAPADGWAIRAVVRDGLYALRVDAMLHAMSLPVQVREANAAMGRRAVQIAAENFPSLEITDYAALVSTRRAVGSVPVVLALLAREHGIHWRDACAAHVFTSLTALTQNAVRGIPIGQNAGQRVLRAMHPEVTRAVDRVAALTEDQVGAVSPALEIDQMRHAWQRARMFMS
ncbi:MULTISPECIES: urease accessory protein UreF [Kocuria]|uniref:urease accessory protein UreF n=1 Tax=Kocuria TaxID=57493 RepID=UPI00167A55BE|nr:urease accessory UreF family protein [Kocuria sp. CPCC 104605]